MKEQKYLTGSMTLNLVKMCELLDYDKYLQLPSDAPTAILSLSSVKCCLDIGVATLNRSFLKYTKFSIKYRLKKKMWKVHNSVLIQG